MAIVKISLLGRERVCRRLEDECSMQGRSDLVSIRSVYIREKKACSGKSRCLPSMYSVTCP